MQHPFLAVQIRLDKYNYCTRSFSSFFITDHLGLKSDLGTTSSQPLLSTTTSSSSNYQLTPLPKVCCCSNGRREVSKLKGFGITLTSFLHSSAIRNLAGKCTEVVEERWEDPPGRLRRRPTLSSEGEENSTTT